MDASTFSFVFFVAIQEYKNQDYSNTAAVLFISGSDGDFGSGSVERRT
jgi:hypothetical protein